MFLQQVLNGLVIGSVWSLVALGFTMVYSVIRLMNFAHGGIFMLGAYYVLVLVNSARLPVPAALSLAAAGTVLTALAISFFGYRPLFRKSKLSLLLVACGFYQFMENLAIVIWGGRTRAFPVTFPTVSFRIGDIIRVDTLQLFMLGTALVLMLALHLFITRTKPGAAVRAIAQDTDTAYLMGIRVERMIYLTFALGALLAIVGSILIGTYYNAIYPRLGFHVTLVAFAACVVGGMGSLPGAMVGGLVVGVAEGLGAAYVGSGWREAVAFVFLIVVLLVKPTGLLGRSSVEKV